MQDPGVATYLPVFAELAARDRFGAHTLCEDPEEADLILFLDGHQHFRDLELRAIREHPLVKRHREKAFVYSEVDQPWCAMPGLYVAMPRNAFDIQRQRACSYLTLPNAPSAPAPLPGHEETLLFSFMGRAGNRTRERILRLRHPRACIADTSSADFFGERTDNVEEQKRKYAEVMTRSQFILCPRGAGTSSFRIFETLAAGRVPVIVSDGWVPPRGPDWSRCAVFIPEREVALIGAVIETYQARFLEMGAAAATAWREWFAPDVTFHRMVESLADIVKTRRAPERVLCRRVTARYLRLRLRAAKAQLQEALRVLRPSPHGQPIASRL